MFVELIYDKRNFAGLPGAREAILNELTKRMQRIFPEAEVRVKPMMTLPAINTDASKHEKAVSYTHLDVYKRQLLRSAGAVAQPASAIYVAIFNAAIGTGAFVGGQLIASAGLSGMVWLAAGIMVGSTLLIALLKAPLPGQVSAATAGA